jgi:2-isopropylmalate synthase
MARRITIFDTTLRDGEQSPGASLTPPQKLEIARQLARLGVDVLEAGFPISSPGDAEAVRAIAKQVKGPVIAALARALKPDIDVAAKSLAPAKERRIHVFLATSPIHRKFKLRKAEEEIVRLAVTAVKHARRYTDNVEFSPEDASRTEPEFLYRVLEAVIDAGATTVNIPDTVGYAVPEVYGPLIRGIADNVPNIGKAVISCHCQNDLGLATANSLAGIANGAGQVECTINGIGERAGNASLEEIVMALALRPDVYDAATGIRTKEITKASRMVSHLTGMLVQPNKAIVGENAFRHESGIHQDGVLKHRQTYEIMSAESIGLTDAQTLVLGKHSGRHAFRQRLQAQGYELNDEQLERAFARFKELADKKKEVFDEDLAALVEEDQTAAREIYKLAYVHTSAGSGTVPTATIKLEKDGKLLQDAACGDGPVDACYKTINRMVGFYPELLDYTLRAVTKGEDALGEVSVRLRLKKVEVSARGTSTDVIEASAKAYVAAVNKLLHARSVAGREAK